MIFFVANVTAGTIEAFPASYFTTLKGLGFVDGETNGGIGSFTSAGATTSLASHTMHLEQIAFVQCFGHGSSHGNGGHHHHGHHGGKGCDGKNGAKSSEGGWGSKGSQGW